MSNYVIVLGYGWSGSSAVVDLLNEYEGYYAPDVEFRLIKDPYGLIDLKNNLVKRWDPLNSDIAIKDFMWLVDHLKYNQSSISLKAGLGYEKTIGKGFERATEQFLKKLINFEYESRWWFFDFKKSKLGFLRRKIERRLKIHRKADWTSYFTYIDEQQFDIYVKEYIDTIFSTYFEQEKCETVILDQAVPTQMYSCATQFFENVKVIIVDRDPRDIYVDLINGNSLIGKELNKKRDPQIYEKWHNAFRNVIEFSEDFEKNVLKIKFEDLVLKYEETVGGIEQFLGLDKRKHVDALKYFDPSLSRKNIGLWKEYSGKNEIEYIYRNLCK